MPSETNEEYYSGISDRILREELEKTFPLKVAGWITVDISTHPVKNGCWVKVLVLIRHNSTDIIHACLQDQVFYTNEPHPSTFIWTDGNFSCDCNRKLFFNHNVDDDALDNVKCSHGMYSVNLINALTGEAYYKEFDL